MQNDIDKYVVLFAIRMTIYDAASLGRSYGGQEMPKQTHRATFNETFIELVEFDYW